MRSSRTIPPVGTRFHWLPARNREMDPRFSQASPRPCGILGGGVQSLLGGADGFIGLPAVGPISAITEDVRFIGLAESNVGTSPCGRLSGVGGPFPSIGIRRGLVPGVGRASQWVRELLKNPHLALPAPCGCQPVGGSRPLPMRSPDRRLSSGGRTNSPEGSV